MSGNSVLRSALIVAALAGNVLLSARAYAEQFVVADATYTHSAQTTTDSHYKVDPTPETPADWTTPVDYAHGSVHVRLEVKTKPSDVPTRFQVCFEMKVNYNCTDQVPAYTVPGVYEWDTDVQGGYRPGPVDFSQGILRTALILKDTNNVKPAPENVGAATSALYMPSDLHVTVTVVASGSQYMPPSDMSQGGSGGGGAGGAAGAGSGGVAGNAGLGGDASGSGGNAGGSGVTGNGAGAGGGAGATMGGSAAAAAGNAGSAPLTASGGSANLVGSGAASNGAGCALASRAASTLQSLLAALLGASALLARSRHRRA